MATEADVQARNAQLEQRVYQLENALMWIRLQAGLHYMGGAFEPAHMRSLSDLAADALNSDWAAKAIPDFETTMEQAHTAAQEWAERMASLIPEEAPAQEEAQQP